MAQFLDIFSFLSVLLRGATLALESLVVGGVIFILAVLRTTKTSNLPPGIKISAVALAIVQVLYVSANSAILMDVAGLTFSQVIGARFCLAGGFVISGALGVGFLRRRGPAGFLVLATSLILTGSVMSSHAAARIDGRVELVLLTLAHHLGSAAWIGGLPYLLWTLRQTSDRETARPIASRFSRLAMLSVAVVIVAGSLMGLRYVGDRSALEGTSYSAMLLSKVVLTLFVLFLGALNWSVVRDVRAGKQLTFLKLRRFGEAEIGIGFTVIMAAASLTSSPPASDVARADRVRPAEIVQRMTPVWPRMETPPLRDLSPPTNSVLASFEAPAAVPSPSQLADIAWSEYNHHWAGMILLAAGTLALLARRIPWARHWPLVFLALAAFLFFRADAENWPLGPHGFWESFRVAEVAQHRIFVLLIIAFGVFEWAVRNGRLSRDRAGLVFPLVCAVGGALVLTHSHSLANVKEEFLAELSHLPIAVFAVAAGWSRWIELRAPGGTARWAQWVWPVCFISIGAVLLNYREG